MLRRLTADLSGPSKPARALDIAIVVGALQGEFGGSFVEMMRRLRRISSDGPNKDVITAQPSI
jgi:hypothetical protein